jgi:hypothetical protein
VIIEEFLMKTNRWMGMRSVGLAVITMVGAGILAGLAQAPGQGIDRESARKPSSSTETPIVEKAPVRVVLPPAQFGTWVIEASSALAPQAGNTYGPENLVDAHAAESPGASAWVEGAADDGIGEWVEFIFGDDEDALTMSTITIANGYGKSREIFLKNNRVKSLRVSYEGGEETVTLQDDEYPKKVRLEAPVRTNWIRLTIAGVYPGSDYRDTAISDLRFDIESFNYYPPLDGREMGSPDGSLSAWIIPVSQKAGAPAESLVQIWSPKEKAQGMPKAMGAFDHTSETGSNGRGVVKAAWTPDSQFFVYTTMSSGGHSPWHATGYFYDRRNNRIRSLDDFGVVVLETGIAVEAPDLIEVKAQSGPGDIDGTMLRVNLSSLKPTP